MVDFAKKTKRAVVEEGPEEPAKSEPIHLKYRPQRLQDVLGQPAVIKSLQSTLKATARPHTFLFMGPAGTGKTTLARIVAKSFDCDPANMIEVDAASNSGIDDMRQVTQTLRYNGFGASPNKAIIIDECQGLSKQAWDSLLKSTEEPPPHVFFFFCSTNPGKIPAAMTSRAQSYNLSPVRFDDLMDLLEAVCEGEGFDTPESHLAMVAQACEGSPRRALTMLAKIHDCQDKEEVAVLLETALDNAEVIDLCRALLKGNLTWPKLTEVLAAMPEVNAESIRIIVVNYLNACLMKAKSDKEAFRMLDILGCFMKPCNPADKLAPILLAFGQYIFD